jgi:hypothetical protein
MLDGVGGSNSGCALVKGKITPSELLSFGVICHVSQEAPIPATATILAECK